MEVTSQEQVEQGLGSRTSTKVLSFALRVELAARPFWSAFAFSVNRRKDKSSHYLILLGMGNRILLGFGQLLHFISVYLAWKDKGANYI